jgi:hypothetical protein
LIVNGRIFGQALSFVLPGDTYYGYDLSVGPDLLERLSPTQWLGITGLVKGTVTGSDIHAVMDGRFEYSETAATATRAASSVTACQGKDSGIVLRRR